MSGKDLSREERQKLQIAFQQMDDAADGIRTAMLPFVNAIEAIEGLQQSLLDQHGIEEIHGFCEHCETILLTGDKGLRCEDGPILCEECAPTWDDARLQWKDDPGADAPDPDRADFMARYEDHIAAGGKGSDKFLQTF